MSAPVGVTSSCWIGSAIDRRVAEQPDGRRRRHRKDAVRRVDHAAAHIQRRAHDRVGRKPLEPEHRADDVDDRIERADLVQVHLLDGHLMDRGFRLGQSLEQRLRTVAAAGDKRRAIDQREDLRQAAVGMRWLVMRRSEEVQEVTKSIVRPWIVSVLVR